MELAQQQTLTLEHRKFYLCRFTGDTLTEDNPAPPWSVSRPCVAVKASKDPRDTTFLLREIQSVDEEGGIRSPWYRYSDDFEIGGELTLDEVRSYLTAEATSVPRRRRTIMEEAGRLYDLPEHIALS